MSNQSGNVGTYDNTYVNLNSSFTGVDQRTTLSGYTNQGITDAEFSSTQEFGDNTPGFILVISMEI